LKRPLENEGGLPLRRTSSLLLLAASESVAVVDCHNRLADILPWAPQGHPLAILGLAGAYRSLYRRYIRLTPALRETVDQQAATILQRRPVLAVHYRAQSAIKTHESVEGSVVSPGDYVAPIDRFLADYPRGSVFLLTDVAPVATAFKARYGERLVMLPARRLSRDDKVDLAFEDDIDGYQLATEVITDTYVAAACDAFLGDGASNVSCMVELIKDWAPGTHHLLRANMLFDRGKIQPF
jgi:hypothetical protein